MKKFLVLLFVIFSSTAVFAQLEVKPGSFKEVHGFVNTNPDPNYQTDDNELPFAVIKVRTENITDKQRKELIFEGNAGTFIMLEYKVGEVWVYLTAKYADYLKISHPEYSSVEYTLPCDLVAKHGYELTLVNTPSIGEDLLKRVEKLENAGAVAQNGNQVGYITVKSVPKGADVLVDNNKVGVTPYLSEEIGVGNHKISVSLEGYEPMAKRVVIENEKEVEVAFELVSETPINKFENKTFTVNGVSFDMIAVKGGTFVMGGTPEQGNDPENDERPTHSVTLSDFYIGKYEVTQQLWKVVMGSSPTNWRGDNYPIDKASWNDCQTFINRLNQLTGGKFRLPTEAEWEYAARGGNKNNGYKYSGSNNIDEVAWYNGNSGRTAHIVGAKKPNELGLYDMNGNVWEWCNDFMGNYSSNSQLNPTGPSSGYSRTIRGGSWYHVPRKCRVSDRDQGNPSDGNMDRGFRLVCDAE